ncbi:MAG: acetyl-CoA C-acetyltransferase [candidate division WOR-3 bacterium]|nr:acetyl-CoA C-acetyltransferase [candidate division WOR-3 bacterium]MCX7836336.1 acetyl-CoA C-acetyltransferase [candidate division WOR-3 bacterium]MDW8113559.1 acetyl-CoA C-acetyltransferase [candidate division WOR-3 bacterium]
MYIIGAKRTPIGRFLSSLASFKAPELGAIAIKGALEQSQIPPEKVNGVIMGNVCPAGLGQAPARQAQIKAGLSPEIPALTVNKVCGSGLISVVLACQAIKAGDAKVMVAGGQESMSNVPYYLHGLRMGVRMGEAKLVDGMIYDGIWCAFEDVHMGMLAEFTAERSGITREMQDKFAYESHMKAVKATKEGRFNEEIIPIVIPQKKGEPIIVKEDEGPRPDTSLEKLAQLKPVFKPDGTVTAGNASQISDGAAAVVVASEDFVKEYKLQPLAKIVAYAVGSVEPKMLFYAPVKAIRKILDVLKVDIDYFDLIEVNEAFAAQVLADGKELNWNWEKVNVKGGGVALGHPIGASGTRILVTLIYALKEIKKTKGLAAICLGGGEAVAMAIEVIH